MPTLTELEITGLWSSLALIFVSTMKNLYSVHMRMD